MRISKKDKAEYQRLKNNVKSKIRRTQRAHGLDLSNVIDIPELTSFTRKDFNIWKEQATKFTKSVTNKVKKNEYGVPYTNMMVKVFNEKAEQGNKIKDKFNEVFDKKDFTRGGETTGLTVRQFDMLMKEPDDLGTKTKRKFDIHSIKDLRSLEKNIKRITEEADIQTYVNDLADFKENWIEGLEKVFNSSADSLVAKVKELDPAIFYEMYKSTGEMHFEEWYLDEAGNQDEFDELLQSVIEEVEKHFDEKLKNNREVMLLKGFPDRW